MDTEAAECQPLCVAQFERRRSARDRALGHQNMFNNAASRSTEREQMARHAWMPGCYEIKMGILQNTHTHEGLYWLRSPATVRRVKSKAF